jgi:hypothetical protein
MNSSMINTVTVEEQNEKHYRALLDSVTTVNQILNGGYEGMQETMKRLVLQSNHDHMELMLAKTFWTDQDLSTVRAALERVKQALAD